MVFIYCDVKTFQPAGAIACHQWLHQDAKLPNKTI